jgi:hypothetical protein
MPPLRRLRNRLLAGLPKLAWRQRCQTKTLASESLPSLSIFLRKAGSL